MKHGDKGFTLMEVLVALVILSIALSALVLSNIETTRNIIYLEEKTIANWIADNVIAETRLHLITPPAAPSQQKGTVKMLDKNWTWAVSKTPTKDESTEKIVVNIGSAQHQHLIEVIGFTRVDPK